MACGGASTSGPDAAQPGRVVHVDLTAPGAAALASAIGGGIIAAVVVGKVFIDQSGAFAGRDGRPANTK